MNEPRTSEGGTWQISSSFLGDDHVVYAPDGREMGTYGSFEEAQAALVQMREKESEDA